MRKDRKSKPGQDTTPRVTQDDILRGLQELGVRRGELVYVHSSLSAFGYVDGGADAVIDALLAAVGPEGTVAVPTFTWERNHAKSVVEFDVANDPSEVGRITEVFRQRPEAIRNEHVCHSTAAIGPATEVIMGGSVHPFAYDASLYRCYELDSWYIFLGCGFSSGTALHTVEEMMQVPYRYYRGFEGSTVIRPDGTRVPAVSVEFLRQDGYRNDFAKMDAVFQADGILRHTHVGNATLTAARIRDVINGSVKYLEDDICYLLDQQSRTRWYAQGEAGV
ncbi:MAG: AAC(3) family N-acetyltransferase [Candidatus Hydrogenedentota bacterium]